MVLSRVERSLRGGLERDFEGVIVVGVRMRTSICAMEATSWLVVHWSDLSCVLERIEGIPLVEKGALRDVDVVVARSRCAI